MAPPRSGVGFGIIAGVPSAPTARYARKFMAPPRNGGKGIRTPDPLLAKQVLSQLSYTPIERAADFTKADLPNRRGPILNLSYNGIRGA